MPATIKEALKIVQICRRRIPLPDLKSTFDECVQEVADVTDNDSLRVTLKGLQAIIDAETQNESSSRQ